MDTNVPRIPPPVGLLIGIILMVLLNAYVPIGRWLHYPWRNIGIVVIVLGLCLGAGSGIYFRKLGTNPRPGAKANLIVTTGPFKYTRNPMYISLLTILAGTAILLGTFSPLIMIPIGFIVLRTQFIEREERWMENWFGEPYLEYKRKTPRWL